jgi:glutamate-1-semialdehyde 2,1-aminomutase
MPSDRSRQLQQRAEMRIPAGVDSPVRAFRSVGGNPIWIERGAGAYISDVDGNRYLDLICSWGALLFGHAEPGVTRAIQEAATRGTSFGLSSPLELALAEAVIDAFPSIERIRFVNSGTEATMSAVRLARGFTKRDLIVKFEGCYHGHADMLLAKAGSGVATLGLPGSAGVPDAAVQNTLVLPYNDIEAVRETFRQRATNIAAVIVEPVAGNMGCVPPAPGFLQTLRQITSENGALLIFDEVITGFRVARGGASERFKATADLTTLGKIIGGGLPVGAYGGRAEIMQHIAPIGPVYQAGTLSGNPLAMAAGIATLREISDKPELYNTLERRTGELLRGLSEAAQAAGTPASFNNVGSMWTVFFTSGTVRNFQEARSADIEAFGAFHRSMVSQGVLLPPAQLESAFLSAAHGDSEVEQIVRASRKAFEEAAKVAHL